MTANTGEQSGGTGFRPFSPDELARESAPSPAPLKAQAPAPQIVRNSGEQKAAPQNLPDGEASLKAPAPVAPFDAGEPKAQLRSSEQEMGKAQELEEKKEVPVIPAIAPKASKLKRPGGNESVKDMLPKIPGCWWECPAHGKGASIKLRWREGEKQKTFVFARVGKAELETLRNLPDEMRRKTILDRLESDEKLAERPDAAARLRNITGDAETAK